MAITRGENFQQIPIDLVGGSDFGRYPKINASKTYNMFISDGFLIPYAGYQIAAKPAQLYGGKIGRGIFTSVRFNGIVTVIDDNVLLVRINYNQATNKVGTVSATLLGRLETTTGHVYIVENNKPQLAISDNKNVWIYDPTLAPGETFVKADLQGQTPGYLTFHDTYFIVAIPSGNSWRLSSQNEGYETATGVSAWRNDRVRVGLMQSKPDKTQAVVRFPSRGNMIFVMGQTVTESWFNTGAALFPYQRNNQFNIDYGCLNPATVAYMDEYVVWLASNEQSGPIIMYSDGGSPQKITTDGIDYLFSTLTKPEDSQAFLFRQDGHVFYHINFYTDNLSLFYDFTTQKFFHACDEDMNVFIAIDVAFYNNQYYFISNKNGNIYAFDTELTTYQDLDSQGNTETYMIPRIRVTKNIRILTQDYFVINDVGVTIESGETNYVQQSLGPILIVSQDGDFMIAQDGSSLIGQQDDDSGFGPLSLPAVDLSVSRDGGASFGADWRQYLPAIGHRKNKLMWWQLGIANDAVLCFRFNSYGRIVATDSVVSIRI